MQAARTVRAPHVGEQHAGGHLGDRRLRGIQTDERTGIRWQRPPRCRFPRHRAGDGIVRQFTDRRAVAGKHFQRLIDVIRQQKSRHRIHHRRWRDLIDVRIRTRGRIGRRGIRSADESHDPARRVLHARTQRDRRRRVGEFERDGRRHLRHIEIERASEGVHHAHRHQLKRAAEERDRQRRCHRPGFHTRRRRVERHLADIVDAQQLLANAIE